MVSDYLYDNVHYSVDFCSAANRANVRAIRSEGYSDYVAAGEAGRAIESADGSSESGANAEVVLYLVGGADFILAGRGRPALHELFTV
jgi:hypothetical protein